MIVLTSLQFYKAVAEASYPAALRKVVRRDLFMDLRLGG